LLVTLFFSLSVGMIVSAVSRDSRQAMMLTVGIVIFFTAILPAVRASLRLLLPGANLELTPFLWLSTGYTYRESADAYYIYRGGPHEFWGSLLTISALAHGCLLLAMFILPRAWQEKALAGSGRKGGGIWQRLRFGSLEYRRWIRASLLETNPFHWLTLRDRSPRIFARMLMGVVLPLWLVFIFYAVRAMLKSAPSTTAFMMPAVFLIYLTLGSGLLFKCLVAIEASRRLSDDRQSGALELLLVTPLSIKQILAGQKRALWKHFRVTLFILFFLFPVLMWLLSRKNNHDPVSVIIFLGNMVVLLTDFNALGWVGMWAGLRSRQHHRAVLITLARILFLPWLLIILMAVTNFNGGSVGRVQFVFALWFMAGVVNDFLWAKWARNKLRKQFRPCVASTLEKQPRRPGPEPLRAVTARAVY